MVWVGLVAMMGIVAMAYLWERRPRPVSLPVIGTVGTFALTNQFGIRTEQGHLENLVWVADVIFTQCPGQCHQLSQAMRQIQERLPLGARVRLVSLTANPGYDSPAVLARYGARYGYATNNWLFLTGLKADVYRLAVEGLKFSVVENEAAGSGRLEDQFIHSASFAIVDRRGRLRAMVQAEDPRVVEVVLGHVKQLLKERD